MIFDISAFSHFCQEVEVLFSQMSRNTTDQGYLWKDKPIFVRNLISNEFKENEINWI